MHRTRHLYTHLVHLYIAVFLLTACRGSESVLGVGAIPTPTSSEALRRDAHAYAKRFGVCEEEALQRLQYQDEISELANVLETSEADTFGGLWIEHEPAYRIVVRFTRHGKRTVRPYLKRYAFAHLVEVREAQYTLVELETIKAQALRELAKLDFDVFCGLVVQHNRVEVAVSDRAWFEGELRRVNATLPEGVELIVAKGGLTAKDKDRLLTPPVPGIAFPRQKPVEGLKQCRLASLIGTLRLDPDDGCLRLKPLDSGEDVLPIWPPEYTLRVEGEQVLVIDREGQVAARVGEEVLLVGGYSSVTDEWVLQQIPAACRGTYFAAECEARPNLRYDSDLFHLDVIPTTTRTLLFLRYKPVIDEQVTDTISVAGKLVAYDYRRCLHLQTDWGPGTVVLLWPPDWSVRVDGDTATVLDGTGQAVARLGDDVLVQARSVPPTMESPLDWQLIDELPGDCAGTTWLVDGIE